MKKTLALLTLSLLLVAAMILGVSAKIESTDVGMYIRFDSEAAIVKYVKSITTGTTMVFDAEKGAMHYTATASDEYVHLHNFAAFDIKDYPYMRITYAATRDMSCHVFANIDGDNSISGSSNEATYAYTLNKTPYGFGRYVYNWTDHAKIKSVDQAIPNLLRFDIPNDNSAAEVWIYDIGFFKTVEAATAYSYNQTSYVLDMTDPAVVNLATPYTTGGVWSYDNELGAAKFVHNASDKNIDARARVEMSGQNYFSMENYPYGNIRALSGVTDYTYAQAMELSETERNAAVKIVTDLDHYIINTVKQANLTNNLWSGNGGITKLYFENKGFVWQDKPFDFTTLVADRNGSAVVQHVFDPINKSTAATGTEYRAYKYIAYYATAEEAALESQGAPRGLKGVMPEASNGTGKITGLNADLSYEYRVSGNANSYTAVEAGATEITGLEAGKTYDVRLAGEEGVKNPGYAAEVGVPAYAGFAINSVEGASDAVITEVSAYNWKVELPIGTNITAVKLNMTATHGAKAAIVIHVGKGFSPVGAMDVSANIADGTPITLAVYEKTTLYQPVTVTFALKGVEGGAQGVADAVANGLAEKEIPDSIFAGAADADAAKAAIEAAAGVASFEQSLPGLDIEVVVENFVAATAGIANDIDGEDGSLTYKFTVAYQGATAAIDAVEATVPANHFRILWKFNDQALADTFAVEGDGFVKNDNGKLPIVSTTGGKYYMRAQIASGGKNGGEGYIKRESATEAQVKSGDYTALFNADDYPYVVYSYRSSEQLPYASGSAASIYWGTEFMINNNTYVKASGDTPESGIYYGYLHVKNWGLWGATHAAFPKNTEGTKVVIDYNNGTNGVNFASNGAKENADGTIDYNATVKFPWKSDVVMWRHDFAKSGTFSQGQYMDFEYIAFFSTKEAAEAFAGEVAHPFSNEDKQIIDNFELESISGEDGGTLEDATVAVAAAAMEAFSSFNPSRVEVVLVSYKGYNLGKNTKGQFEYYLRVYSDGPLGDRDLYTRSGVYRTAIDVPEHNIQDAIDQINALAGTDALIAKGYYAQYKNNALSFVKYLVDPIMEKYSGYNYKVEAVSEFVAPGFDETKEFVCKVVIGDNGEYESDELTVTLKGYPTPVILSFASPITRTNFTFTASGRGNTIDVVESEDALGGAYAKYVRPSAGSEFNLSTKPGVNGMPAMDDLDEYTTIVYRYKAVGNEQNQIYFYTDSYTGGNMYYDLSVNGNSDDWYNHQFDTSFNKPKETPAGSVIGDGSWANTLESIRFDFFRSKPNQSLENATLEIEYIAFFGSTAQATAFMNDPTFGGGDNPAAEKQKYQAYLDIVDAVETTEYTVTSAMNEGGYIEDAKYIVDKYFGLPEGTDYYIVINDDFTENVLAAKNDADYEDFTAIDGKFTFTVAFSDNPTNGYVFQSKEFTVNVLTGHRRVDFAEAGTDETIGNFIRIGTLMNKDWMANVKGEGTLTYGMLITSKAAWDEVKADYVDGFTFEAAEDLNAGEIKFVQNVEFTNIYAQNQEKNTITHTARIAVPEGQEDTTLYARAYVKYTFDGVEVIDYFGGIETSFNKPDPNAK